MEDSSSNLWTTYKDLVANTSNPKDLVDTFGDTFVWAPGSTNAVQTFTTDNTNGITVGASSTPNITISPGSPSWWVPTTLEAQFDSVEITRADVELSAESKELLSRVEEKLDALLGKHPFAKMANLRKALDEVLAEKGDGYRFEGMERKRLPNGLEGWDAKYSYPVGSGRGFVSSGIMPTENEALAQLIRLSQG